MQWLSRQTARNLYAALLDTTVIGKQSMDDAAVLRVVGSDRYGPQLRAEKELQLLGRWTLCYFPCAVHLITRAMNIMVQLHDTAVSGMIALAMTLEGGGWHSTLRREFLAEIEETIEIVYEVPTVSALQFRHAAIKVFASTVGLRSEVSALCALLPIGDWQLPHCVQVSLPPHLALLPRVEIVALVKFGLSRALIGRNLIKWNYGRWLKNDVAASRIGLWQSCHKLCERTVIRFLNVTKAERATRGANVTTAIAHNVDDIDAIMDDYVADESEPSFVPLFARGPASAEEHAAPGHAGVDGAPAVAQASANTEEEIAAARAREKVRMRSKATSFLMGRPLRDVTVIRLCMEPGQNRLRKQLYVSGQDWERRQQSRQAVAIMDQNLVVQRDYRLH